MSDIYICASNIDRDIVLPAVEALEKAGFSCCVPGRDFGFGIDWQQKIIDSVNGAVLILYFDSDASRRSIRIASELKEARNSGLMMTVIPVDGLTHEALLATVEENMGEALRIKEKTMKLEPYEGDGAYIFISFAEDDRQRVFEVLRALSKRGYRLWFISDEEPGAERDDIIAARLDSAAYMIPFFSKAYFEVEDCKDELFFARELGLDILPIYIEEVMLPPRVEMRFGRRQALFYYKYDIKEDFYGKVDDARGIEACRG